MGNSENPSQKREHWLGLVLVQKLAQSDFFELINKIYTVMEGKYNYSQFLTEKKSLLTLYSTQKKCFCSEKVFQLNASPPFFWEVPLTESAIGQILKGQGRLIIRDTARQDKVQEILPPFLPF